MNGLYGYPTAGAGLADLSRLGAAEPSQADKEVTARGILTGETYTRLKDIQREIMEQAGRIGAMSLKIEKLSGTTKASAQAEWEKARGANLSARRSYETARDKYNEIANYIRTYTLKAWNPPSLSDLGAAQFPIAAIVLVIVGLVALRELITAFTGAKSYVTEANTALENTGKIIGQTGQAIFQTSEAGINFAKAALIGVAVWAGYQLLRRYLSRGPVAAPAATAAPQLTLKPVEGRVI